MSKLTATDFLTLEASILREIPRPGGKGSMEWTAYGSTYALEFSLGEQNGTRYVRVSHDTVYQGFQEYAIPYEARPAEIGGVRFFWICPKAACARRVGVLYRPLEGTYFLCRHCYHLAYASQSESKTDRLWRKYHHLRRELQDPVTSGRRPMEVRQQFTDIVPAIRVEMEQSIHALEARVDKPLSKRRTRGRPSPKKQRAERRAANGAERDARPQRPPGRPKEKRSYVRQKPFVLSEKTSETQAYCPKCRDWRELVHGKPVTFANGRPAIRGECATCGTPMSRIVQSFYESGVDCFPKA